MLDLIRLLIIVKGFSCLAIAKAYVTVTIFKYVEFWNYKIVYCNNLTVCNGGPVLVRGLTIGICDI